MDKQTDLISRLQDEADLCRNDGASDIAALLEEAADKILSLHAELQHARDGLTKGRTRMREDNERLRAALRQLVDVEDMRLRLRQLHDMGHGTDYTDYHRLLPMAWAAAREALGPNVGGNRLAAGKSG